MVRVRWADVSFEIAVFDRRRARANGFRGRSDRDARPASGADLRIHAGEDADECHETGSLPAHSRRARTSESRFDQCRIKSLDVET